MSEDEKVMWEIKVIAVIGVCVFLASPSCRQEKPVKRQVPTYARGDVLESKLGERLLVDKLVPLRDGGWWYYCDFYEPYTNRGLFGESTGRVMRSYRAFELHEIKGKWPEDTKSDKENK